MRTPFTPYQLATWIWSLFPLASRAVNVTNWNGSTPNALIAGRVDANAVVVGDKTGYSVSSNGDKTGYSLAAGSYSVVRTIADVTVSYNTASGGATSSSAATGVTSAAKSVIHARGAYWSDTASTVPGMPSGAWEWSGTSVQVRHSSGSRTACSSSCQGTATWAATVVEYY